MARGVNKAILIGNIGQEPKVGYLPSGACAVNFSVATSESWKDKQTGEQKEQTEWHRVCVFGKLGEVISGLVGSGSKVYVEGKSRTREYDKQGVKCYTTEIVAERVEVLDGKRSENGRAETPAPLPADNFDDDIPF